MPDNYSHYVAESAEDAGLDQPEVTIIAADPEKVSSSSPMAEVSDIGLEEVELKFAHKGAGAARDEAHQGGMLKDLWKGMVEDIMGSEPAKKMA